MRNKKRKSKLNPKKLAKVNQRLEEARKLRISGRQGEALALYREIAVQNPDYADAWYQLGSLCQEARQFGAAFESLRKAIDLAPEDKVYWFAFMQACQSANRLPELETALRKLLTLEKPVSANTLFNLGICLKRLNKSVEAIEFLRQGLELEPKNIVARTTLAFALFDIGETESTRELLQQVKLEDPDNVIVLRQLALMTKHKQYDDEIKHMEKVFDSGLSDGDRSLLGFAIAKAFEDIGDADRYFEYLDQANALQRKTFEYSVPERGRYFDEIRGLFTREFIDSIPGLEDATLTPVFVIGMPRSGTSLVEQIIASHSKAYGAGELSFLSRLCIDLSNALGVAFPASIQRAEVAQLHKLGRDYLAALKSASDGSPYVVDKLPHNFIYAGVILSLFPNAKIIHCDRDPMATCYSIYKNSFGGHHGYAYSQQELGSYYRLYEGLMRHWLEVAPDRIHTADYEALVANPQEETEKLLSYCGLDVETACLEFYKTKRIVATVSNAQVRQPIYKDALAGWKRYQRYLGPLLQALDYREDTDGKVAGNR